MRNFRSIIVTCTLGILGLLFLNLSYETDNKSLRELMPETLAARESYKLSPSPDSWNNFAKKFILEAPNIGFKVAQIDPATSVGADRVADGLMVLQAIPNSDGTFKSLLSYLMYQSAAQYNCQILLKEGFEGDTAGGVERISKFSPIWRNDNPSSPGTEVLQEGVIKSSLFFEDLAPNKNSNLIGLLAHEIVQHSMDLQDEMDGTYNPLNATIFNNSPELQEAYASFSLSELPAYQVTLSYGHDLRLDKVYNLFMTTYSAAAELIAASRDPNFVNKVSWGTGAIESGYGELGTATIKLPDPAVAGKELAISIPLPQLGILPNKQDLANAVVNWAYQTKAIAVWSSQLLHKYYNEKKPDQKPLLFDESTYGSMVPPNEVDSDGFLTTKGLPPQSLRYLEAINQIPKNRYGAFDFTPNNTQLNLDAKAASLSAFGPFSPKNNMSLNGDKPVAIARTWRTSGISSITHEKITSSNEIPPTVKQAVENIFKSGAAKKNNLEQSEAARKENEGILVAGTTNDNLDIWVKDHDGILNNYSLDLNKKSWTITKIKFDSKNASNINSNNQSKQFRANNTLRKFVSAMVNPANRDNDAKTVNPVKIIAELSIRSTPQSSDDSKKISASDYLTKADFFAKNPKNPVDPSSPASSDNHAQSWSTQNSVPSKLDILNESINKETVASIRQGKNAINFVKVPTTYGHTKAEVAKAIELATKNGTLEQQFGVYDNSEGNQNGYTVYVVDQGGSSNEQSDSSSSAGWGYDYPYSCTNWGCRLFKSDLSFVTDGKNETVLVPLDQKLLNQGVYAPAGLVGDPDRTSGRLTINLPDGSVQILSILPPGSVNFKNRELGLGDYGYQDYKIDTSGKVIRDPATSESTNSGSQKTSNISNSNFLSPSVIAKKTNSDDLNVRSAANLVFPAVKLGEPIH